MRHGTKPLGRDWWLQFGLTLGFIGLATGLGYLMHVIVPAEAKDGGFFNCFHLDDAQKAWFGSSGISRCCNLADGMPVRFEDRPDGTYIVPFEDAWFEAAACRDTPEKPFNQPHPDEDRSAWQKVKDELILRKNNPIGIGVVWWTNAGYPAQDTAHDVRCFVGLPKV